MKSTRRRAMPRFMQLLLVVALTNSAISQDASADDQNDIIRWSSNFALLQPQGASQGDPLNLTWSIVPDGTPIPALGGIAGESSDASDLVARLGVIYGVTTADNIFTDEPWFPHFQSVVDRWGAISGITYTYEPNDDSAAFTNISISAPGVSGVRGDVRIGGHDIDGDFGVLAYNFFPNHGDMVVDTNDFFYTNTSGSSIRLRNTLAHEMGHGLGLPHVISDGSGPGTPGAFLLEPSINTLIDGPQYNDILLAHRGYGDVNEKSNAGQGNDTSTLATSLGPIADGSSVSRGEDARDLPVAANEIDFVSIDDQSDTDFYSFSVSEVGLLDVLLEPLGPTYNAGPQGDPVNPPQESFNASTRSDLTLTILDTDGSTPLATSSTVGLGVNESTNNVILDDVGTYFVRVTGADNPDVLQIDTQFYALTLSFDADPIPEPATLGLLGTGLAMVFFARRSSS